MKLEDVLPEMRKARRARPGNGIINHGFAWLDLSDITSVVSHYLLDDWELEPIPEQKIELTFIQFDKSCRNIGFPAQWICLLGEELGFNK